MDNDFTTALEGKTVLVTGAAKRIGASLVSEFHRAGASLFIHFRSSADQATALATKLNGHRPGSAFTLQADLNKPDAPTQLIDEIKQSTGRLDVLVNNASDFFATPLGSVTQSDWDSLINSNLRGPFFLSQAAAPLLRSSRGLILNILDIHASKPLRDHSVYCMAKAGLSMMTRALAQDLAPEIRVNGIAPGAIVWPEQNISEQERQRIVSQTPMGRTGDVADISGLAVFLATDAEFITGQVIAVDGGRSVSD